MNTDQQSSSDITLSQAAELADFAAAAQHITDFTATYNAHHAHPFTWKKGVRFYQRMKDRLDAAASTAEPPMSTDVAA